jgi:hypothetical protein
MTKPGETFVYEFDAGPGDLRANLGAKRVTKPSSSRVSFPGRLSGHEHSASRGRTCARTPIRADGTNAFRIPAA